ncbi:CYTH domain-containing protein [Microbacterium sp. NPDC078428]|uniref:CYTH domain-containing protein n=1 Tax=Microbacterium sp. NPDC078428 TaxID=3364190 RepID=UPI0037C9BABE
MERTYDAGADAALPDLRALPGVARVDEVEHRDLDAVYLDTAAMTLAAAAVAVRRRTGGPDEGWHVKTSAPEGRHEYGWPLDVADLPDDLSEIQVPAGVREAVSVWTADEPLSPLARVRNARRAVALRDAAGEVLAEFTDDHVVATDLRAGRQTRWREWELELGPAAPDDPAWREEFFAAADAVVCAAGGAPPSSGSKLQRALGL